MKKAATKQLRYGFFEILDLLKETNFIQAQIFFLERNHQSDKIKIVHQ